MTSVSEPPENLVAHATTAITQTPQIPVVSLRLFDQLFHDPIQLIRFFIVSLIFFPFSFCFITIPNHSCLFLNICSIRLIIVLRDLPAFRRRSCRNRCLRDHLGACHRLPASAYPPTSRTPYHCRLRYQNCCRNRQSPPYS